MRTTLTLDDDVAAALERLRKTRDESLKALINDALRRGLRDINRKPPRTRLRTRSADLGRLKMANIDNIAETISLLEGDRFK